MVERGKLDLMWPVIGLVVTGLWHFTIEAIWPNLQTFFVLAVLAPCC